MSRAKLSAWLPAVAALVVMATRALHAAAVGLYYEDAFITLRYARNLAEGHGFVFNQGERVLGTTTPLFALLLAPVGWFAGGAWLRPASVVAGIACTGVVIWLLFRLCRRLGLPDAVPLAATLLVAVSHELVEAGVSGMETMLVAALMFAGLVLVVEEKLGAAGAVLALLVVCRVDGAPWVGLVLAYAWFARGRVPWRAVGTFAAVLGPWLLFAALYFGSPIPHTIAAKQAAYRAEPVVSRLLAVWAMVHPYERHVWLLARLLDVTFLVGVVAAVRRFPALVVPAAAGVLQLIALAAFAPHTAPWHVVPSAACFALVSGFGAVVVFRWALGGSFARAPVLARALRLGAPAGLAVVALLAAVLRTTGAAGFLRAHMENERAVPQAAALWLHDHSPANATVFAEPIGFLGYYSRRYLWDTVGLVSPKITEYRRRFPADNRWYFESLRDLRPDFVVLRDFERAQNRMFLHDGPLLPREELAWFDAHYRLERTFAGVHPGTNSLAIFRSTAKP